MIGTLIVDDQEDMRTLLRFFIEAANEDLSVVGEAADGEEALAKVDELDPRVIVLDQMMPGIDGIETARQILARRPNQSILLCSAYLDDNVTKAALAAGIKRCVPKMDIEQIPEIVRACA